MHCGGFDVMLDALGLDVLVVGRSFVGKKELLLLPLYRWSPC